MIPELQIGMSWKHVKVINSGKETRYWDNGNGIGWHEPDQEYFEAQCDCGKVFRIWADDWKGKKYIPDCGCGISLADGEHVVTMISASNAWRQSMKKYAAENGISLSRAIVELSANALRKHIEDKANA
jgi:hypothetical protein